MGSKRKQYTPLAEHFEHPVSTAARSLTSALEGAVDLVAGPGYAARARTRGQRRRRRFQAATSIQALFRGHKVRQAGRQRMQIVHNGILPHTMPPRRRRRRGKRAPKRKRRTSYTRRRRKSYRSSRKRRKSSARTRLRLYPSGFPKTHLIKLRVQKQVKITNAPNQWAFINLYPAQCSDPFVDMRAAGADYGPHRLMQFTLKAGTDILPRPQPYGWDEWANGNPYAYAVVEGSKTQITFIQSSSAGVGSTYRMLAGFSALTEDSTVAFLPSFNNKYPNVDKTEISDMLNCKIITHPKALDLTGNGMQLSAPNTFTFNYSRKKTERRMKKMGSYTTDVAATSNYMFQHATFPVFNPQTRFIIADIGATAETITYNAFITIEYTIRLMNPVIPQESDILV